MELISSKRINPRGNRGAPLLIVGEAPGAEEEREGLAFVGDAGQDLDRALATASISQSDVYIMNLCNYRPHDNDFNLLRESNQLKEGLNDITTYLTENRDKVRLVLLLGKEPLRYILGKSGDGAITNWRGSFLKKNNITVGVTYHPAYITRQRELYPILCFDFRRAKVILEQGFSEPKYNFTIDPKGLELESCLREIEAVESWISIDIETTKKDPTHVRCLGVGLSANRAICFKNSAPFGFGLDPTFRQAWKRVKNCKAKKMYHNGYAFDTEIEFINGINDQIDYDTLIAANSLNPEFPLGLDFLTSIYTWQACYWDDGPGEDKAWSEKKPIEQTMEYCCKDCVVLFPIKDGQESGYLNVSGFKQEPLMKDDFEYKMSQIPLARHIGRSGMFRDQERLELIRKAINKQKEDDQILLNSICGREVNCNGKLVLRDVLYNQFKLPIRKKRDGAVTADEDAIISLIAICQEKVNSIKTPELRYEWEKKLVSLKLILKLRGYHKLLSSYIDINESRDGRVRSIYKIAGTETNRWSCTKYVDRTGLNAQTFPRDSIDYEERST